MNKAPRIWKEVEDEVRRCYSQSILADIIDPSLFRLGLGAYCRVRFANKSIVGRIAAYRQTRYLTYSAIVSIGREAADGYLHRRFVDAPIHRLTALTPLEQLALEY